MTRTKFGRVVDVVTARAASGAKVKIGLEAIESETGRLLPVDVDYEGDGISFEPGDLLFGKLRPYLAKSWVADRSGSAIGDFHVYRPNASRASSEYLHYVTLSRPFLDPVVSSVNGAKMPRASWGFIRNVEIYLPSIQEQGAIAHYLDRETARVDTLIAKQEQLIATLRERWQRTVDSTFSKRSTSRRVRLRYLLSSRPTYGVLVPQYVDEPGAPFVKVGDLLRLRSRRDLPRISQAQSAQYTRTRLAGGEILLGVVGNMGQAAIAPAWLSGANVARAVAVLRCADPGDTRLLALWLTSSEFLNQAGDATAGDSVQPTLGMGDLGSFRASWPGDTETRDSIVERLASHREQIDTLISKAEQFIALSRERRAALITAAVTGQIDVSTAA